MITITELTKRYHSTEVLQGVSLSVRRGEVSVILGPSGGGKSTLLRAINGLETFDSGQIQVDDLVIGPAGDPQREHTLRRVRLRVGMVFQQFNLFPHRNVLQNVIEAPIHVLRMHRDAAIQQARALLDRVGLADKFEAMPGQLSGGQQQRVAIARTLAMQPEAILFDEPTSGLDPRMTNEVVNVIADLARSGQTMVVVTHAMSFAQTVAHTVHVMHAGRVAESGPPDKIFNDPQREVTRDFLTLARID
jgi:ABC-type polar amino acid transport system ATPase subunit